MPNPRKNCFSLPCVWALLLALSIILIKMERSPHPSALLKWFQDKRLETQQTAGIKYLNMLMPTADAYRELVRENGSDAQGQPSNEFTKYYEQIVALIPENAQGHSVLGFCYYRQGLYEKAYEQFEKSCLLDPHMFWACQDWAVMDLQAYQYSAAEKLLSLALNSDPRHTMEILSSSRIYYDILASDPSYDPAISLQQGYTQAAKALYLLKNKDPREASKTGIRIKIF